MSDILKLLPSIPEIWWPAIAMLIALGIIAVIGLRH